MTIPNIDVRTRFDAVSSRHLLLCGAVASAWYAGLLIAVPRLWDGYCSATQTISELSAVDAPTRTVWGLLAAVYTLLMLAFGWGLWRSAGADRALRSSGAFVLGFGALGLIWPFAPMHLRPALAQGLGSWTDTLHLTLSAVSVVLMLLAMTSASMALGTGFAVYSLGTMAVVLAFGVLTGAEAASVAANQPTPFIGVWERISVGAFLAWVATLSVVRRRDLGGET